MYPGNYEDALEEGRFYNLRTGGRYLAWKLIEHNYLIAWILENQESTGDSVHSLWLTPTGILCYAERGHYPFGSPPISTLPLGVLGENGQLEPATYTDLTVDDEIPVPIIEGYVPPLEDIKPLTIDGDPLILYMDDDELDMDVWGDALS